MLILIQAILTVVLVVAVGGIMVLAVSEVLLVRDGFELERDGEEMKLDPSEEVEK